MIKNIFGIFFFITLSFAQSSGASTDIKTESKSIENLYTHELLAIYKEISPLKELAQKEKKTYIISAIIAILVFVLFTKYFKFQGFLVSLIMIGSGAYVLYKNSKNIVDYQTHFKKEIISKISKNCCGFEFISSRGINKQMIKKSRIFAPDIKEFNSIDLYEKDGVKFGFVVATFDTKESASVERFNKNRFEGFFIVIDGKSSSDGVMVSDSLREKVANMDIAFNSFFADDKRGKKEGEWSIYGDISKEDFDRADKLSDKDIAISFYKDKIFLAIYQQGYPFSVDIMSDFTLKKAMFYEDNFKEIDRVIKYFR